LFGELKLFVGKLIPNAEVVHNRALQGTERKFEIISLINASKWEQFDEDIHGVGTFIAWDLKNAELKVTIINKNNTV